MAVDKTSLTIIVFLTIIVTMAGIFITGVVPKIFDTGEKVDQALVEQHEDEGRAKQSAHEDAARDKQRYQIVNETNTSLNSLENDLKHFIEISANRSAYGAAERQAILESILEVSNQQASVAAQHGKLQKEIENITLETLQVLNKFGAGNKQLGLDNKALLENLTQNVQELKELLVVKYK